ncbi:MAG: tetratricopeptide repeat protein [Desulfuromonadales bacterium]
MNNRHRSDRFLILYFLLPVLLSGCAGGSGQPVRSGIQLQSAAQLERGIRAQSKGEVLQAEKLLSDSLKLSSSIEDDPARITALINLARLNRLHHKPEAAELHIDQALKLARSQSGLMAEAAYEKALIELAQKHIGEALTWATTSLSSDNGGAQGKHLNLLARIHRTLGNRKDASSFAIRACEENQRNGQLEEEANSLRMLGSIERENRRFAEAGKLLLKSLEIDRQIGESHKIALDLEELAALSGDQGDLAMMVQYLERAFSVYLNGGHMDNAASTQLKMAEIHRKTGNMSLADKAEQTAEKLMRKESSLHSD